MESGKKIENYSYSATSYRHLTYEKELLELVQLSEVPLDNELFKVIFEMLKENVAPNAIVHVLKALRAASTEGHRITQLPPLPSSSSLDSQSSSTVASDRL